jgi:hypothetical protein
MRRECTAIRIDLGLSGRSGVAHGREPGYPGGDLLAGGDQAQAPLVEVDHPVEDQGRLVRMQLPDFQGDDAPGAVGEHREWQDRIHPEGIGRLQAPFLTDQQGVLEVVGLSILCHIIAMIKRNADDFEAIPCTFAPQALQQRDLAAARLAPGRPEVDDQEAAAEVTEAARAAVEPGQADRGQVFGNPALRDRRFRWRHAVRIGRRSRRGRRAIDCEDGPRRGGQVVGEKADRGSPGHQGDGRQGAGDASRRRGIERIAHELVALTAARVCAANSSAFMNPTTRYWARSCPSGP